MSKQRRTADDFVRDMKAKQQHSTPGDIERKTSEGLSPEQASAWRGNRASLPGRYPLRRAGTPGAAAAFHDRLWRRRGGRRDSCYFSILIVRVVVAPHFLQA